MKKVKVQIGQYISRKPLLRWLALNYCCNWVSDYLVSFFLRAFTVAGGQDKCYQQEYQQWVLN